ncbi:TPA: hypothetical protein ACGO8L_000620 [Streptococcus suis]
MKKKIKFFIAEAYRHKKVLIALTVLIRFGVALWDLASAIASRIQL